MIKAAAGGGGKGMRVVKSAKEMEQAFVSATNEASKSFSDGRIFIEKYVEFPRHIEVQIVADKHGNVVCLGGEGVLHTAQQPKGDRRNSQSVSRQKNATKYV